jgi:hypothetical protein
MVRPAALLPSPTMHLERSENVTSYVTASGPTRGHPEVVSYGVLGCWGGRVQFLEVAVTLLGTTSSWTCCQTWQGRLPLGAARPSVLGGAAHSLLTDGAHTPGRPSTRRWQACRSGAQRWTRLYVVGQAGRVQIPALLPVSPSEPPVDAILSPTQSPDPAAACPPFLWHQSFQGRRGRHEARRSVPVVTAYILIQTEVGKGPRSPRSLSTSRASSRPKPSPAPTT